MEIHDEVKMELETHLIVLHTVTQTFDQTFLNFFFKPAIAVMNFCVNNIHVILNS